MLEQAAEAPVAHHLVHRQRGHLRRGHAAQRYVPDSLMWSLCEVLGEELVEQVAQVFLPEDHEVVQALASACEHETKNTGDSSLSLRWFRNTIAIARSN